MTARHRWKARPHSVRASHQREYDEFVLKMSNGAMAADVRLRWESRHVDSGSEAGRGGAAGY